MDSLGKLLEIFTLCKRLGIHTVAKRIGTPEQAEMFEKREKRGRGKQGPKVTRDCLIVLKKKNARMNFQRGS